MTYKDRIAFEHPEAIYPLAPSGVLGCPHDYGFEDLPSCGMKTKPPRMTYRRNECAFCWGQEAPPRKVKPRRKEHEKANA